MRTHPAGMFVVTEAEAAAIRAAFEQRGELSAAVELRRRGYDPFSGGMHTPDVFIIKPILLGDTVLGYAVTTAHHADVGGRVVGTASCDNTDIFQEGLRIPPVLIQRGGKIDRDLLGLVLANVRTPVEREGDLMAQLMSLRRGEMRLRELVAKYGEAAVERNMQGLQNYSERMMRATLRGLSAVTRWLRSRQTRS